MEETGIETLQRFNKKKKDSSNDTKINKLDCYIIFCIAFLVVYTIAHTVIFAISSVEAPVLDGLVYATFGGEILQCYFIKRGKLHKEMEVMKRQNTFEEGGEI